MNSQNTATVTWRESLKSRLPRFLWNLARTGIRRARRAFWYARKTRYGIEQVRNVVIDWKYGGYCGGRIPTKFALMGATGTSSTDYYQLDKIFGRGGVQIRPDDVLVDVGCGKGRVLNYWLYRGYKNRMYGLELDPDIAGIAAKRLSRFPDVCVLAGDAIQNLPDDGTLFFLFNPFAASLMEIFKERMKSKFRGQPIRMLYYRPQAGHIFAQDPECDVKVLNLNTFYPTLFITLKSAPVAAAENT